MTFTGKTQPKLAWPVATYLKIPTLIMILATVYTGVQWIVTLIPQLIDVYLYVLTSH